VEDINSEIKITIGGLFRMKKISETRKDYLANIRCAILEEIFQMLKQRIIKIYLVINIWKRNDKLMRKYI
jgi:hypothetical protein